MWTHFGPNGPEPIPFGPNGSEPTRFGLSDSKYRIDTMCQYPRNIIIVSEPKRQGNRFYKALLMWEKLFVYANKSILLFIKHA